MAGIMIIMPVTLNIAPTTIDPLRSDITNAAAASMTAPITNAVASATVCSNARPPIILVKDRASAAAASPAANASFKFVISYTFILIVSSNWLAIFSSASFVPLVISLLTISWTNTGIPDGVNLHDTSILVLFPSIGLSVVILVPRIGPLVTIFSESEEELEQKMKKIWRRRQVWFSDLSTCALIHTWPSLYHLT
jgi:ABC-type multidrug transport system fused ATPase/permease subunit